MKALVIGGNGQLGTDVVTTLEKQGHTVCGLIHSDLDITDIDAIGSVFASYRPSVVVNTAAMHHVENCEKDPTKAFAVNALGARNVAAVAQDLGAALFHISTDYVFDGLKENPYVETDAPMPLNVYGNTKLSGEHFVRSTSEKHFVLRVSGIYGKSPCRAKGGLNFVELMLKLARERGEVRVVDNEFVTPTSTRQIAEQILALIDSNQYGLYHATAEGSCSWYQFAREIFDQTGTKVNLIVAAPNEFPAKVQRPQYSVLENARLKASGLNRFQDWQSGLAEYLAQ